MLSEIERKATVITSLEEEYHRLCKKVENEKVVYEKKISEKRRELRRKSDILRHKVKHVELKKVMVESMVKKKVSDGFQASNKSYGKRKLNPTSWNSNDNVKRFRRNEVVKAAEVIHGGSKSNPKPTLNGLLQAVGSCFKISNVIDMVK